MSDRHDIVLREDPKHGSGLLKELRDAIDELFPVSVSAAGQFISGRGQQEIAKAAEIRSVVLERIGRLENERQSLIDERDQALRKLDAQHTQEMYKLKTERLRAVVESLKTLHDLGVKIDMSVVAAQIIGLLDQDSRTDFMSSGPSQGLLGDGPNG